MEFLDIFLHIDKYLAALVADHGNLVYAMLFAVIFCETGLVVTPFLPGDSLLFAIGSLAGAGMLDLPTVLVLLSIAAILGDACNFAIGKRFGHWLCNNQSCQRFIKPKYIAKTEAFYETHGGKTIVMARFVPIVRTFAPFVAGMAGMCYRKFALYNVAGGLFWIGSLTLLGYSLGSLPIIKNNFSMAVYGVIALSLLPMAIEFLKHRAATSKAGD